MITIGIDPHKSSLTAAAMEASDEMAASVQLPVNGDAFARLRSWAQQRPQRR